METTRNNKLCIGAYFFQLGGIILLKVESLMIILLSLSLDIFSPPYYGGLTMLLGISCTETCNKYIGVYCFS